MSEGGVDARAVFADRAGELEEGGELAAPGPFQPSIGQRDSLSVFELKHLRKLLLEHVVFHDLINPCPTSSLTLDGFTSNTLAPQAAATTRTRRE